MDPNTEAPGFSYDVDLAISQYHAVYQLHGKDLWTLEFAFDHE